MDNVFYTIFDGTSYVGISKNDYLTKLKTDPYLEIVDHFDNFDDATNYADEENSKVYP